MTSEGYWFKSQIPVYIDVMTYVNNKSLREEIYRAYFLEPLMLVILQKKVDNRGV
jgi:oligopeptidase A